jgi:decaprenylphospho-beta-D-ribofuranose 2-oxidase
MQPKNLEKKNLFSYDKSYSADVFVGHPDKYRELEKLSHYNKNLINVGSNLSYCPLSFDENSVSLLLKKFNRIIDFDLQQKEITIESGATLAELLNFTLKHNLWIPQLPGYPLISLGGAVATNAHGKSCAANGTIRNSIKKILIFHKHNGWLNLSEEENKEIFDLTIGGLGLTGTIINITFKLEEILNKNFTTIKSEVSTPRECIDLVKKKTKNINSFVYSWNMADNLKNFGKGIVFENIFNDSNDEDNQSPLPNVRKNFFPNIKPPLWNKFSIKLANKLFFNLNKDFIKSKNEKFLNVIFPFYGKEMYFNFFGNKGFLESQLLLPDKSIEVFFEEFMRLYKLHNPTITLFSIKNMKGNQKFLRFEDNKICLTFDYVNSINSQNFMREVDNLCVKHDILPSIIKDSRIGKDTVKKCYKNFGDFKIKLSKYDKHRVYRSRTSIRLEI